MSEKIEFTNIFLKSIELLDIARDFYHNKDYDKAIEHLECNLSYIPTDSFFVLSEYYDIAASILWKTHNREDAVLLWKKSSEYNNNNRHPFLCLKLLSEKTDNDPFLVFLRLKLNEFYAINGLCSDNDCDNYKEIVDFIIKFWDENLKNINYEDYSEPELAEIFLDIELFEM